MILSVYYPKDYGTSYIAGTGTGVVSVNGAVAARPVYLLSADSLAVIKVFLSTNNGNYLFTGLNAKYRYIVMCRDLAPDGLEQRFEPAVWDYITPATDLTVEQQMELWQSWQAST